MKKLISVSIIVLAFSLPLYSQFGASVQIGFGGYSMSELKDFNESTLETQHYYNINLTQLEDFPVHPNISFDIFYENKKEFRFGIGYQFLTTGSRLYYEDYSGYYSIDIITNANALRLNISKVLFKSFVDIGLYIHPQLLFSNTDFRTTLNLEPDFNEQDDLYGNSINLGANSGIVIRKTFGSFEVNFKSGYYFDIHKGSLKTKINDQNVDMDSAIKNNWTGVRMSLGFSYSL